MSEEPSWLIPMSTTPRKILTGELTLLYNKPEARAILEVVAKGEPPVAEGDYPVTTIIPETRRVTAD